MTGKPASKAKVENIPSVEGEVSAIASANAPFVYFETAMAWLYLNGVGCVTLAAGRLMTNAEGQVVADAAVVAHLRGNLPAIKSLRYALDRIIDAAEPTVPDGPKH